MHGSAHDVPRGTKVTQVRPATAADIDAIMADVRQADIDELWALRLEPRAAMLEGLEKSSHAWVGVIDSVPVCMGGVAPISVLGGTGLCWLIGTNKLASNPRFVAKNSAPCIRMMLDIYESIGNVVDARNVVALRWIRWCGFMVNEDPVALGPDNMPFHAFALARKERKEEA